jgi:hypothetical protein
MHGIRALLGKKNQNQDTESRLRELTERTRRTRHELEELIHRSDADRTRAFSRDKPHATPQFFRRRQRTEK